jgi:hypothetical protein
MNPKPFASLNHLTVPVAMPTSPVTHVPATSPSKSLTTAVAVAPRYKLTTAFFRYSGWVEKSASLIVEALNSTVKKILRRP